MSALPTELLATGSVRLKAPGEFGGHLIWAESLPSKSNIYTLMGVKVSKHGDHADPASSKVDLLAGYEFDVASRIHGYGGRAWWPGENYLFFASKFDGSVYAFDLVQPPYPVTASEVGTNWADGCSDRRGGFVAVKESSSADGATTSRIVHKSVEGVESVLAEGADFYSDPRVTPDGNTLCWVEWNLPNMPWDETTVKTATLNVSEEGGTIDGVKAVTSGESSALNPGWIDDTTLGYVDDRDGYWDLYSQNQDGQPSTNLTAEVSLNGARGEINRVPWFMGDSRWQPVGGSKVAIAWTEQAVDHLIYIDTENGKLEQVETDLIEYYELAAPASLPGSVLAIGSTESTGTQICLLESNSNETILRSPVASVNGFAFSPPENISFKSGDEDIQAFYYSTNSDALEVNGLAPLIVMSHGGPTGYTTSAMNLKVQYWTSRGFNVIDINYRGSTGFGRQYREALNGHWGVADVIDLQAGAQHLIDQGLVDPQRVAIRGGSSGGLTTMLALSNSDIFCCGVSLYGVSDMRTIANHSHKFESGYLDTLIGPLPDYAKQYEERSPINFPDKISKPLMMIHGTADPIVPIEQSRKMYDRLIQSGAESHLLELFGEGHGFRAPENIIKAFSAELWFYSEVMGFDYEMADHAFLSEIHRSN